MKARTAKSLQVYLAEINLRARPRRNDAVGANNVVLASILAETESAGDAMRYLDIKGNVAWRATPQLRAYLKDLQAELEADALEETL
jgi:hypothetical protein